MVSLFFFCREGDTHANVTVQQINLIYQIIVTYPKHCLSGKENIYESIQKYVYIYSTLIHSYVHIYLKKIIKSIQNLDRYGKFDICHNNSLLYNLCHIEYKKKYYNP